MKAWVLHNIGDIRYDDVSRPEPKQGETLVCVKCAGICSSDIPRIFETGAYNHPLIPGHEFAGVTTDGRRVAVFPLLPCFRCRSCERGQYEICENYNYIGSRRDGAFAEYAAVPEWNLIDIPDDMSFETAAMLEPAAVALHAVNQISANGVHNAAVIGDGVIGQLIARWLSVEGVLTVKNFGRGRDGQLQNSDEQHDEFDVCFEAAGSISALRRCIEMTRPNGQIVLVGNPDSAFVIDKQLYWKMLRKQLTVHGTWNSRYPDDWRYAIENANSLQCDELISHKFPLEKPDDALAVMKNDKHLKVMITI